MELTLKPLRSKLKAKDSSIFKIGKSINANKLKIANTLSDECNDTFSEKQSSRKTQVKVMAINLPFN